jgi:hypothetical protein
VFTERLRVAIGTGRNGGKKRYRQKSGVGQSAFVLVCRLFVAVEFWLLSTNFRRKSVKGKFFLGGGGE